MYPLNGNVSATIGHVQASRLALARFAYKLHRELVAWGTMGGKGLCGKYLMPVMRKQQYRFQATRTPIRQTSGRYACSPIGAVDHLHVGRTSLSRDRRGHGLPRLAQRSAARYEPETPSHSAGTGSPGRGPRARPECPRRHRPRRHSRPLGRARGGRGRLGGDGPRTGRSGARRRHQDQAQAAGARYADNLPPTAKSTDVFDFDAMVRERAEAEKAPLGESPRFIAFVSLSMLPEALKALVRDMGLRWRRDRAAGLPIRRFQRFRCSWPRSGKAKMPAGARDRPGAVPAPSDRGSAELCHGGERFLTL